MVGIGNCSCDCCADLPGLICRETPLSQCPEVVPGVMPCPQSQMDQPLAAVAVGLLSTVGPERDDRPEQQHASADAATPEPDPVPA